MNLLFLLFCFFSAAVVSADNYFLISKDVGVCPSTQCGGFWIQEVNIDQLRYVRSLNFSTAGDLNSSVVDLSDLSDYILYGHTGNKDKDDTVQLFVVQVYRALPVTTTTTETVNYFKIAKGNPPVPCSLDTPCNLNYIAQNLSTTQEIYFNSVNNAAAEVGFVDVAWLSFRELLTDLHGALVQGDFGLVPMHPLDGFAVVLNVTKIYVSLPDPYPACVIEPPPPCAAGKVPVYKRLDTRCLQVEGCVTPGPCPLFLPGCEAGYTLREWPSAPNGCSSFACDPSFVSSRGTYI